MWIVALVVGLGALWDGFTTFHGIAEIFQIFASGRVNPFQVTFALVVSFVIMGFMIATHLIWSFTSEDIVTLILKGTWVICVTLDFYTSYLGNKFYVFDDRIEGAAHVLGLMVVTILITVSSMLLSRLIMAKDARGKGYLF